MVDSAARQILHVDMDAFYASIEQRDDPSLAGRPVIVGGRSMRSVVCTASYEARPFGVRSAMPMAEAIRRCPHGVVLPPRMGVYEAVSDQIMEILGRYSPLVEPLSLDEAFLDVTHSQALFGDGPAIASQIRRDIAADTKLTASAGVASSKFVAKVASDVRKPNGLTVVPPGTEAAFLAPLPVERMWGVGPKAARKLRDAGFQTIADLATSSAERLAFAMGSSWGEYIVELARGFDPREVVPSREAVSIGAEDTFETDLQKHELDPHILAQAARVASRMCRARLVARVVCLKVKLADHTLVTRRTTLDTAAQDTVTIHATARALLERIELNGKRVRLTGLSMMGLVSEQNEQHALFPDGDSEKKRRLERTLEDVRSRFGFGSLLQADTVGHKRSS